MERPLGGRRGEVEVRPPQRRDSGEGDDHRDRVGRVAGEPGGADPDRHDRLPERDDHDEREPLGEVRGRDPPTRPGDPQRPDDVDHERRQPHPGPVLRIDEAAHERDGGGGEEPRCEAHHSPGELRIAPRAPQVQDRVEDPDDEVGDREPCRLVLEGVRHGERHEEAGGHRREHDEPRHAVLDVDRVRHPRVRGPRPPHHREHERRPQEALDARVLEDERGRPA